jgi:hypothetical protein
MLCLPADDSRKKLLWGDLHWHSDRGRDSPTVPHSLESPEYGYAFAREVSALDFAALSEHACRLKSPTKDWQYMADIANRFHEPGRFVTILGYEWRGDGEVADGVWGHHIVRFPGFDPATVTDLATESSAEVAYIPGVNVPPLAYPGAHYLDNVLEETPSPWDLSRTDTRDLRTLWELVRPYWATVEPHHLGRQPIQLPPIYPPGAMANLEIYSKWGASEYYLNPRPTYVQRNWGPGRLAQDALAAGVRVGFVGGSDSHATTPGGLTQEPIPYLQYRQPGLTGCYAHALNRKSIWDALLKRQCYAASGQRIIVDVSVNGQPMGNVVSGRRGKPPKISILVAGTSWIRVELLRNNEVIATWQPARARLVGVTYVDRQLPDIGAQEVYYYVRVTQANGEWAWSSPVWLELAR